MNVESERSVSLWMEHAAEISSAALTADQQTDVVVIGSGIAGLSIAYELGRLGQTVIVLDRGNIGRGMTARTTAHLASELDDYYYKLLDMRGLDETCSYYESQAAAISRVEAIQKEEGIDCDFRRLNGYLFPVVGSDLEILEKELEACHRIGFTGVAWADRDRLDTALGGRCLRFPEQARFHPLKYVQGLARCIMRDRGRLFAHTAVVSVEEEGEGVVVKTGGGNVVRARSAIVATNSPINDLVAIHTKQAPYRTYAIAGRISRGSVEDALYWDMLDPYHYVRLQPGEGEHDWLIVGGEDHKTGQANDQIERIANLGAWARRRFPEMAEPEFSWSGQVLEPVDYAAYMGRNPGNKRIFVMTGDSGQGFTNGVAGSLILRDLVLGRDNDWVDAYAPNRLSASAIGEYVSENATMPASLAEHLTAGEVSSADELKPGEGALVRQGLKKIAAYRDERGELHLLSATCTHVGCVVHWNGFESCWDCPCHGSQFSVDGEALNGPAVRPLARADRSDTT